MKTVIIVFSPSGHTLKVAEMIENSMTDKGMQVQLLDITRNKRIFRENRIEQYLEEKVEPHDLICVGGPVYAGHFEGNAMNIVKALPDPDKTWGKLAIPFISYGGLHSSIALMEAGNLFHKRRRKNILGVKIAAFHTLSTALSFKINENKPGAEALPVVEELVERITDIGQDFSAVKDVRRSFAYASLMERLLLPFLSQEFWHGKYKPVRFDYDECIGCGTCVERCPVNILEMVDQRPQKTNMNVDCILCAECFYNCPVNAVLYDYLSVSKKRLSSMLKRNQTEFPQSAVYPLRDANLSNDKIRITNYDGQQD